MRPAAGDAIVYAGLVAFVAGVFLTFNGRRLVGEPIVVVALAVVAVGWLIGQHFFLTVVAGIGAAALAAVLGLGGRRG